jgi:hypothetical protein
MVLVKRLELNSENAVEVSKEPRDATVTIGDLEITVRFTQKPAEHILAFLRENGFRWNGARKKWVCEVEPIEIENREEREAAKGDFISMLDILIRRHKVAQQAVRSIAQKTLQALEGLRVVLIDTSQGFIEIYS